MEDGRGRSVWCWWYWLVVLLEVTHDLHLLMSLYMRDTPVWGGQWDTFQYLQIRCINNIITDILGIVGSWECCTALSPIVKDQWKISTKPALPVLDFNTGIIILLEVNIETLWCSCPVRRLVLVMVEGTRQLSMHFTQDLWWIIHFVSSGIWNDPWWPLQGP